MWPLYYIEAILNYMEVYDLKNIVTQLSVNASSVNSGKDWELITIAAIYFRSLEAMENARCTLYNITEKINNGPFEISGGDPITSVKLMFFPDNTFESFLDFIKISSYIIREKGAISICIPSDSNFPLVDIIIIYWKSPTEFDAIGCQNKKGKEIINTNNAIIPDWISKVILLRGNVPDQSVMKNKCIYYNKDSLLDLLGYSLSSLYLSDDD